MVKAILSSTRCRRRATPPTHSRSRSATRSRRRCSRWRGSVAGLRARLRTLGCPRSSATGGGPSETVAEVSGRAARHVRPRFRRHDGDRRRRAGRRPGLLVAPFAFGLALLAGLYAFGEVSGGHFNPAVSLGLFLDRRLTVTDLFGYWISQFAGAILASLVLLLATSKHEVALTATLALVERHGVRDGGRVHRDLRLGDSSPRARASSTSGSALIAIPLTLLAIHFAAIPFSGSSVNPARTSRPGDRRQHVARDLDLSVAPPLGAVIGWLVHTVVVEGIPICATTSRRSRTSCSPGRRPTSRNVRSGAYPDVMRSSR